MPERTVSIIAILKDQLSPGLSNISKNLTGVKDTAARLGKQFSFLNSTVGRFIAAFAGIQTLRRSLDLAEKQVEATTQLATALEGLPDTFKEINAAAEEFQRTTTVGNEEFQRQAAILKSSGVAAEDLADATRAVFEIAARLGKPVESIRAQLVAMTKTGIVRGELAGALQGVTIEALKQGAAFKILGERFAGSAEALAQTPFGQAKQQANLLGDTLEELGGLLIDLKTAFLEAANVAVKALVDYLKSPAWEGFKQTLIFIVKTTDTWLPFLVKIVALYKAWQAATWLVNTATIALNLTLKALGLVGAVANTVLLAPWALIPILVGAAVIAIQQFVDIFGSIAKGFGDLSGTVSTLFGGIVSGSITAGEAIEAIKFYFARAFIGIDNSFFIPVRRAFEIAWAYIQEGWERLWTTTELGFRSLAGTVALVFLKIANPIARLIDDLSASLADVGYTAGVISSEAAQQLRTNLEFQNIKAQQSVRKWVEDSADAAAESTTIAEDAISEINARLGAQIDENLKLIDFSTQQIEATLDRAKQGVVELQEESAKGLTGQSPEASKVTGAQLRQEEELQAQINLIRAGKNQEGLDILAAQNAEQLDRDFKLRRISEEEYAKERLAIVKASYAKETKEITDQLKQIEAVKTQRIDASQTITDLLQKQIELETQLQEKTAEEAKAIRGLSDEIDGLAGGIAGQAETLRSEFNKSVQETAELARQGVLSQEEALGIVKDAYLELQIGIANLESELQRLQAVGGDTEAFETAAESIAETWQGARETIKTTNEGIVADTQSVWSRMGESFRSQLVGPLTDFVGTIGGMFAGLETGFDDANDAIRDFGKKMLQMLADILVQWLIMRALGVPTFGTGGGVGAGASAVGLASGGTVPGPSGVHTDTVPALLTPGEFVMRESAADYYGPGIMRALNQMMFPKSLFGRLTSGAAHYAAGGFQMGGEVRSSQAPSSAAGPTEALVVPSENAFERLLAGGSGSMLRFLQAHRTEINGILGA